MTESPPTTASLLDQLTSWKNKGLLEGIIDLWREMVLTPPVPDWVAERLKTVGILLNKRGIELFSGSHVEEALSWFLLSLRAQPDDAAALNNAATCYKELGQLGDSTMLYRRALALQPGFSAAHSNLLMNMHYKAGVTLAEMHNAHQDWDQRHAAPLAAQAVKYHGTFEPDRPLSIGLVSADLGQHPVGYFLVRYLENIDRKKYIISAYAHGQRQDALADRLRATLANYHDTQNLDDAALADKIKADGIDILIDLSGHTERNRLGVFARRPAPVQIGWLGYPGEGGLSAIDYVIGDRFVLPQSMQPHMRARILQLPDCFVCFDPPADAPPTTSLPAKTAGHVTFGCFANPAKCGEDVISLWAAIMNRLPHAKILFKYKGFGEAKCRARFEKQFSEFGIASSRLSFEGASPLSDLFKTMQSVDIALDPFPFSGGLMTCLTLWMGLPVVTLPMQSFASNQGLSFLTAIGITDTIAVNRQDYADKAVALANDLRRLSALRGKLRPAMAGSPLCDGPRAAAALQNLLRDAWRAKDPTS